MRLKQYKKKLTMIEEEEGGGGASVHSNTRFGTDTTFSSAINQYEISSSVSMKFTDKHIDKTGKQIVGQN